MIREEEMRIILLRHVKNKYKTQKEAALAWGISPSQVSQMIIGFCPITQSVLDEMGYVKNKMVCYEKK